MEAVNTNVYCLWFNLTGIEPKSAVLVKAYETGVHGEHRTRAQRARKILIVHALYIA